MKRIFATVALALISGCTSLEPAPAKVLAKTFSLDPTEDAFQRLKAQYDVYDERAKRLVGDSNFYNGLSATAAIATLGFAAFEAHKDNVLAAALIGGISNAAAGQLKPGATATFYRDAENTLLCIQTNAMAVRTFSPLSGKPIVISELLANPTVEAASFEQLREALVQLRSEATTISAPSKELVDAVANAQLAEAQLDLGIHAINELPITMNTAMDGVYDVVQSRVLPTIQDLLAAIAKVEYKKPDAAPAKSSGGTDNKAEMTFRLVLDAEGAKDKQIVAAISAIIRKVAARSPTDADKKSKAILACPIAFATAAAKPAK